MYEQPAAEPPDPARRHAGGPRGGLVLRLSRRTLIVTGAAIAVAIAVLALVLTLGGAGAMTAHGSMEVDDFSGDCLTDSGFADITQGTQVVVTNPAGSVVGTSSLVYDSAESAAQSSLQSGLSVCIYTFTVNVPGGLPRYAITVSHRGAVWFTAGQMAKGPGLSLSSGGSGF